MSELNKLLPKYTVTDEFINLSGGVYSHKMVDSEGRVFHLALRPSIVAITRSLTVDSDTMTLRTSDNTEVALMPVINGSVFRLNAYASFFSYTMFTQEVDRLVEAILEVERGLNSCTFEATPTPPAWLFEQWKEDDNAGY